MTDTTQAVKLDFIARNRTAAAFNSLATNLKDAESNFKRTMKGVKDFRGLLTGAIAAIGIQQALEAIGRAVDKNLVDKSAKMKDDWSYAWKYWGNIADRLITESAMGLTGLINDATGFLETMEGVNAAAKGNYMFRPPGSEYGKGNQAQMSTQFKTPDSTQGVNRFGKSNKVGYTAPTKPDKPSWTFDKDIMGDLDAQIKLLKAQAAGFDKSAGAAAALVLKQQLLNEMTRQGHEPTERELLLIEERVSMYRKLIDEMDKVAERQEMVRELTDTFKQSFVSFGQAIAQGTSFTKALTNELKNLSGRLLEMSLNKVFDILFGTGQPGAQQGLVQSLFMPTRAGGGPTERNRSYLVGENGPEVFTPGTSGYITPNHGMASGGGNLDVKIFQNIPANVNVSKTEDGRALEISIDAQSAAIAANPYSRTSSVMTSRGAKPQTKKR